MTDPRNPPTDTMPPTGTTPRRQSDPFAREPVASGQARPSGSTRPGSGGTPVVVRRRASGDVEPDKASQSPSGGFPPLRDPLSTENGLFGVVPPEDDGYAFDGRAATHRTDSGLAGTGRAGHAPTAEVNAGEQALLARLGHTFASLEPLAAALTHPSSRNERSKVTIDNQRLEFLGDLVLGLAVGDMLLTRLPGSDEGEVSVLKSQLVRERTLAEIAQELGVGAALRLGRGEEAKGGRERPAVLADALEAIVGAVFVDAGYEGARALAERLMAKPMQALLTTTQGPAARQERARAKQSGGTSSTALHAMTRNYKTALQEWLAQAHHGSPEYKLVCEFGSPAARLFRVQVEARVAGRAHRAQGEGPTVKAAENAAAGTLFAALTATA